MSDEIRIGSVSGQGFQIGGHGNQQHNNFGATWLPEQPAADPSADEPGRGVPVSALYAFADIVGYSKLSARLQKMSQDDLADLLDVSLAEAGIRPDLVEAQDQGDARLLRFPPHAEPGRVLAVMPRHLNDELLARNQDMAPHAQIRIRLSYTMGVALPGGTGLAGAAPIAVVRLGNSDILRRAMAAAPGVQCGVIIDNYLHGEYVRQGFRADISPDDFVPVRVSNPEKGFDASAWMKLLGYSRQQIAELLP
jgi:hypothetical protein